MRLPRMTMQRWMITVAAFAVLFGFLVIVGRLAPGILILLGLILAFHVVCFGIGLLCLGILWLFGRVK